MTFKVIIEYPSEIEKKLKEICSDIKTTSGKKGEEFNYEFKNNKLIIGPQNKKKSYARGFWFRQKAIVIDNYNEDDRERKRENRRLRRKIRFEVKKYGV